MYVYIASLRDTMLLWLIDCVLAILFLSIFVIVKLGSRCIYMPDNRHQRTHQPPNLRRGLHSYCITNSPPRVFLHILKNSSIERYICARTRYLQSSGHSHLQCTPIMNVLEHRKPLRVPRSADRSTLLEYQLETEGAESRHGNTVSRAQLADIVEVEKVRNIERD